MAIPRDKYTFTSDGRSTVITLPRVEDDAPPTDRDESVAVTWQQVDVGGYPQLRAALVFDDRSELASFLIAVLTVARPLIKRLFPNPITALLVDRAIGFLIARLSK